MLVKNVPVCTVVCIISRQLENRITTRCFVSRSDTAFQLTRLSIFVVVDTQNNVYESENNIKLIILYT